MEQKDYIIKIMHKSIYGKISYETSFNNNDNYYYEECDEMFTLCVRVLKGAGFKDIMIKEAMENWLKSESKSPSGFHIDFTEKINKQSK